MHLPERLQEEYKEVLDEVKSISDLNDIKCQIKEIEDSINELSKESSFFSPIRKKREKIGYLKQIRNYLASKYRIKRLEKVKKSLDNDILSYWKNEVKRKGLKKDNFTIPKEILTRILKKLFQVKFGENYKSLNFQDRTIKITIDEDSLLNTLKKRYNREIESIKFDEEDTHIKLKTQTRDD